MKKLKYAGWIVVLSGLWSAPAMADVCADYCDYLCRHYRQDLKPTGLSVRQHQIGRFTVTTAEVRVKNVGDVAFGNGGEQDVQVSVQGIGTRTGRLTGPVNAGQYGTIRLGRISNSALTACTKRKVRIDGNKQAGQWGCNVFSNDTQVVLVTHPRTLCRRPSPGLPPGTHHFE